MIITPRRFRVASLAYALASLGLCPINPLLAAPQGGSVVAGSANISAQGSATTIVQTSDRAIINWRDFSSGSAESIRFFQPSASSATLNRVTGQQMSVLKGRLDANGQVILINPNGILIGRGAQINVGSLIASTSALGDDDFMAGRLRFTPSGIAGQGIRNEGTITAAEGGLVALVAPHVRNDGVIEARLGRVQIGAADRFTIDLYGDGLINLSLDESHRGALRDADGAAVDQLISMNGAIDTAGGQTVLIAAADAGAVLDRAINLQGTVRAEFASEQAGKIVLSGGSGRVDVGGQLLATGQRGGTIDVTGDQVRVVGGALIDAHGSDAGGRVRIGGDWQGQGALQRSSLTEIAAGSLIDVHASGRGNGGQAVVWSDGQTRFAGAIDARGATAGGNGGQVEVSGKQTLDFAGRVDAGAANGAAGSLLLDPETMNIGLAEAALINRVLRTGTSTTVSASVDINVNSLIDGRGRASGGGLTLAAGRDINLNDYLVTQNGAVNLIATTGTVNFAAGKAVFTGSGAIGVSAGGNLALGNLFTTSRLDARSTGGSVTVAQGIDALTGTVALRAAQDLTVAQPITNFANGSALTLTADSGNIILNAQLDGRAANGVASGPVSLVAGNNILLNQSIVSEDGPLSLSATGGTVTSAAGQGLFAGSGAISVTTGGALSTGIYGTTGALSLRSTGGTLTVAQGIDALTGPVALRAAQDLTVNQPITNFANGSALTLTSDSGNIVINAQLDGRAANGVASGPVSLVAGNNILLNQSVVSEDSPLGLIATSGTVTPTAGQGLFAGSGAISVTTGGALSTGIYGTTGGLNLRSTGGTLTVASKLDETLGNVTLQGGTGVDINQGIANIRNGSSLTVIADAGNINVNARIDAQDDADPSSITPVAGGAVTLSAANNVAINETLVTFDGAVNVTATAGTVSFSDAGTNGSGNKKILSGSAPITITTGGNFSTGTAPPTGLSFSMGALPGAPDTDQVNAFVAESLKPWVTLGTTGKLTLVSTGGNVSIDAPIPQTTGEIEIRAGNDVVVNDKLVNAGTVGKPISITAGTACTVGTCDPTTQGRIVVNNSLTDGGINITYINGGTQTASVGNSPEIDSRQANLTMTAFGDIDINEAVAGTATVALTSTSGKLFGTIGDSRFGGGRPQNLILAGGAGIGLLGSPFSAGQAGTISATSANGPIYLFVNGTSQLTVTAPSATAGDIVLSSGFAGLGATASLSAGRDIDLRNSSIVGNLTMDAGRDILVETMTAASINVTGAGQDVIFDATGMGQFASLWLTGPLTVGNVGRDILFLNETGLSLVDADGDPTTGAQPALTLAAARNVELRRLQTYGAVNITAGDDILLANDIGPVITSPVKFTVDKGVAALTLSTGTTLGDTITMQGARAVGDINITTHTLNAAKSITSTSGNVSIAAVSSNITAGAIGTMDEMLFQPPIAPAIPPGPAVNAPVAPAALNALAPAAPSAVAVGAAVAPGGVAVGAVAAPAGGGDELVLVNPDKSVPEEFGEIIPEGDGSAGGTIADNAIEVVIDSPAQVADFGRSGPFSGRSVIVPAARKCSDQPDGKCA